jgi:hypothetical protein
MVIKHLITIHDTYWPFSAEFLPYLSEPLPYIGSLFIRYTERDSYHSWRNLYHTYACSISVIQAELLPQLAEPLPYKE